MRGEIANGGSYSAITLQNKTTLRHDDTQHRLRTTRSALSPPINRKTHSDVVVASVAVTYYIACNKDMCYFYMKTCPEWIFLLDNGWQSRDNCSFSYKTIIESLI